jgi:hypothetical protein
VHGAVGCLASVHVHRPYTAVTHKNTSCWSDVVRRRVALEENKITITPAKAGQLSLAIPAPSLLLLLLISRLCNRPHGPVTSLAVQEELEFAVCQMKSPSLALRFGTVWPKYSPVANCE